MANHPNFFRTFVNGLCLPPLEDGLPGYTETGIDTEGAIWVYNDRIRAYINANLREVLMIADGYSLDFTIEDADSTIVMDNANLEVESSDASQRDFKITSAKAGNTTLTFEENFTVGDGYDVTITAEDAASSITLDEQTFEVEGEGTASRLFKLINSVDEARTLTFGDDFTITAGSTITMKAEDNNTSITMDNVNFEVENTNGTQRAVKITSDKAGDTTLTFKENLTLEDGYDLTVTVEDAAGAIVLDNANFEVENTDGTQRSFKITSAKAGNTTITIEEDLTIGDGAAVTITAEDAAGAITLDNCGFEVEDDVGSGNTFKMINATDDASRSITMSENLTIGDGADVTITAEDNATSVVMDNANFEVESTDASQRNFKITSAKAGNITATIEEDLTIGDGAAVTITAEDAAGSLTLDNMSIEVEDEVGSGNTFKFVNATSDASRTVTMSENLTIGDGADVTITAEDAAGAIVLDNVNFEVEDTVGSGNTIKIANATDDASRTITLSEDFTIGDGNAGTLTYSAAGDTLTVAESVTLDGDSGKTLTIEENLTIADGSDVTITAEDAAGAIVLDNINFEVEDTVGSGNTIKIANATDDASRTITLSEDFTIGDGNAGTLTYSAAGDTLTVAESVTLDGDSGKTLTIEENLTIADGSDVTITAEDAAGAIVLDNINFEVEDTVGSGNTIKIISGTSDDSKTVTLNESFTIGDGNAGTLTYSAGSKTLTVEDNSTVNQDLTTDADVSFATVTCTTDIDTPLVTNDSADVQIATTTSGDIDLASVDKTVIINKADATNATTQTVKFGDDTGGITGIRNNSGVLEFNAGGAGWTAVGSGSGSGINYIDNPSAENDTTGWGTYADAAGTSPVDGDGGSPTVTWTRDTTTPLRGIGEFVLTKDAANRQGEGADYEFTCDVADQGKVLKIKFDYVTSADYDDDDVGVFIYDVTNSAVIWPVDQDLKASTINATYVGYFQTPIDSTSYRLCFHVGSTNASAYTILVDNVSVGPSNYAFGPVVTDWQSYTPTGTWISGNETYTGKWRRVGDTLEMNIGIALSGAPTATALKVDLPPGLRIDTTKTHYDDSIVCFGNVSCRDAGGVTNAGALYYDDSNTLRAIYYYQAAGNENELGINSVTSASPFTFASGDSILIEASVPIAGWSSSQQISDDADTRVVAAITYRAAAWSHTAGSTTFETVPFDTVEQDTHGAMSAAGVYTAPVSGYYYADASVRFATIANGAKVYARFSGSNVEKWRGEISNGATSAATASSSGLIKLDKGDTVVFQVTQSDSASEAITEGRYYSYFSIHRISGPSAIAANELVAARYSTNAGLGVGSASATLIDFEDLTDGYDTHGAVTTGTWKFTAPISGKYSVKTHVIISDADFDVDEYCDLRLYVNGANITKLAHIQGYASLAAPRQALIGSTDVDLSAGDYIQIYMYHNATGDISIENDNDTVHVSIHRIGF